MHVRRDAMALRDAGFEVELICDRQPGDPLLERVDGITVVRIPPRHRRGGLGRYIFEYVAFPLLAAGVIAGRSLKGRYHWIEINNMPDWLVIAGLIPRLLGSRIVFYSREDMPRLFAADHDLPLSHGAVRLLGLLQRASARLAHRVIATQERARQDLIGAGIAPDKIIVVPNAPDEEAFLAEVPVMPARRPSGGDFRLVTHGLMMKRYGIETLIEAVALVRERIPGIHLEIIGEGEYRPALEALVERLNLQHLVSFTGYLPRYEMVAPRLLRADVGVVPIWTDFQLCNKLVDYLALGIPAITTESAAIAPYLDSNAVYYVERRSPESLAEGILALYLDPDRRAALGAAGHASYRKHLAWDSVRPAYLAVYRTEQRETERRGETTDREALQAAR